MTKVVHENYFGIGRYFENTKTFSLILITDAKKLLKILTFMLTYARLTKK